MPDLMIERIVPWQLNGQKQSAFLCTPEHLDELAAHRLNLHKRRLKVAFAGRAGLQPFQNIRAPRRNALA